MNINILDCTLRDGGYVNNWNFSNEQIVDVLNSLDKTGLEIVECGYLNNKSGKEADSTLFRDIYTADALIKKANISLQKVVMINFGDFDIVNLPPQYKVSIDGIRLAFHKKDLKNATETAKRIIELGYKLYFQPMVTKNYTDMEFLSLLEEASALRVYSFYVVDSFGSMTLEEFQKYMLLADENLDKDIVLGYHSHNNMQLAFSNAIGMCSLMTSRNIVIDASIYGIGRGAGNLNTELITDYINNTFLQKYDTLPLLEVIDKFLNSLMKKNPWGFSPAQYLSASFNCHPNYATYLINKNTNHIVGVKKILQMVDDDKKASFDEKYIEKLYIEYILEDKTDIKGNFLIPKDKKVLLVASGKSTKEYSNLLQQKVLDDEYIVIALNHKPDFECDYYFFSNQKRFDEFKLKLPVKKIVITSNILSNEEIKTVLSIRKLVFIEERFVTNVAIVFLNYLILQGIKDVEIAGLDGYKINEDNYNYKETSIVVDKKALLEENKILSRSLKDLEIYIAIEFLTPSIFREERRLRILGIIPARYKSSRFEGKPLCIIKNIPMIKRTYIQAKKSHLLDKLVVATDSLKIKEYCESEDIPVIMTSKECLTGTDRIAEVSQNEFYDLYVNIQGDEPVVDHVSIDEIVEEFKIYKNQYVAYNLYKKIDINEEIHSDTIIKVITNENDELMYMSRLGVPFNKSKNKLTFRKQVCVYGFTKQALDIFSSRDKTINEQYEDIEILRFIDMGYKVKMKETNVDSIAVDIPEDVKKVEDFLNKNGLQ